MLTGTLIALIASVDRSEMATATGLTYLARYTGQVIGVATSSSLLQSVLLGSLQRRISGPGSGKVSLVFGDHGCIADESVLTLS